MIRTRMAKRTPTRPDASRFADAELISLEEAKRGARRARESRSNELASDEVRGAAARAERMMEHLRSFIVQVERGTPPGDKPYRRRLAARAVVIDAMWRALMKKRKTHDLEVRMRFLDAVDHGSRMNDAASPAREARRLLSARFPDFDEYTEEHFERAITAWRSRKKWDDVLAVLDSVSASGFPDGDALRAEYKRWRAGLKT
jgi:hypothetical protein